MKLTKIFFLALLFSGGLLYCASAQAAANIYRSVGPGSTAAITAGTGNNLNISSSTAVFDSALPDNVGAGDAIQYDSDNNGTIDALAFIHSRADSTHYTVKTASGTAPIVTSAADQDWSIFRAYTSLSEAEAGTENSGIDAGLSNFDSWTDGKNLVASDEQWNIACYGDAEDTTYGVVIQDWTTDADNYLKIYTPYLASEVGTSQRHSGVWNESAYHLAVPDDFSSDVPITLNSANVWLDGLQIYNDNSSGAFSGVNIYDIAGEAKISNSIIKNNPVGASSYGVYINDTVAAGIYKFWNNIIYGFYDGGINLNGADNTLYAFNNTVIGVNNADTGYKRTGGTFVSINNIAQTCSIGFAGTFDSNSNYNLSDLNDAVGTSSVNLATLTFAGAEDYRLASSSLDAIDHGGQLTYDSNLPFSTDIENEGRPGGWWWDIGADEYISSSTPSDNIAPTVTAFDIPATSSLLTVTITTFTSADNLNNIEKWALTESSARPDADDSSWEYVFPTEYIFTSTGTKTLYAWVMDEAGNISESLNDSVVITLAGDITAPTVTAFDIPATSSSLTISITTFTATDTVGVYEYLVNESSATPSINDPGWDTNAQTTYTFSSAGTRTLYAWAKDAAGNVSASSSDTVIITLPDITAPTITAFVIPATSSALTIDITTFTANDTVGVTGYMVTEATSTPTATSTSWEATATTTYSFVSEGTKTLYAWAKDAAGNVSTSSSDTVIITLPDLTIPSTPASLSASAISSAQINLTWNASTDNVGVIGYKIYRDNAQIGTSTATNYSSAGLSAGTAYSYYVIAYDAAGNNSVSSTAASATTQGGGGSGGGGSGGSSTQTTTASSTTATSTTSINTAEQATATTTANTATQNSDNISIYITLAGLSSAVVNTVSLSEAKIVFDNNQKITLNANTAKLYDKLNDAYNFTKYSNQAKYAVAYFIQYGTPTTKILGAGERAGSISSCQKAFGRIAKSAEDWQDVIKIANGRYPTEKNKKTEEKAMAIFKKIYKRDVNFKIAVDNNAVSIIAYGLRPAKRNFESEKAAIKTYKSIYKKNPSLAEDWDIVRAVAYGGAKR